MQPKNTIKTLLSFAVVGVFVMTLVAGAHAQMGSGLQAPTLSAAALNSSLPTVVTTLTPTLQLDSVAGQFYIFYVFNVSNGQPISSKFPPSSPIPATGTKTSHKFSSPLTDGANYAWAAKACTDSAGNNCSNFSAYSYFVVHLALPAPVGPGISPVQPPVSVLPTIFSTGPNGTSRFDPTTGQWVPVSGPTSVPTPVPAPTPARPSVINNIIDTVTGWFKPKPAPAPAPTPTPSPTTTLPTIFSTGPNGTSRFDPTTGQWVLTSNPSIVNPTTTLPTIFSTGPNGTSKFDPTTGQWVLTTPPATISPTPIPARPTGIRSIPIIDSIINLFSPKPAPAPTPTPSPTTTLPTIFSTGPNGTSKFDPTTGQWVLTSNPSIVNPTTTLPTIFSTGPNGTSRFDPTTGQWVLTSSPSTYSVQGTLAGQTRVSAPAAPSTNIIVGLARTIGNAIITGVTNIINTFTGKNSNPPSTLSVVNLEVVKVGPGASAMTVKVAPTTSPSTPQINCGSVCLAQYSQFTPLKVDISNVSPNLGNYRLNLYQRDNSPTTHGAFYSSSPVALNLPTYTFNIPGDAELWIEPTPGCGDPQFGYPHWTASTVSSTNVALSQAISWPSIAPGTTYEVQLYWGPTPQPTHPIGTSKILTSTNYSTTLTGNAIDTPATPFGTLTTPLAPPGSKGGYVGISIKKTIPVAGSNPIVTTCPIGSTDDPFWPAPITANAHITITKKTFNGSADAPTQVGYPDKFTFNVTGPTPGSAVLDTDITTTTPATKTLNVLPGTYKVAEVLPTGWTATSVSCSSANATGVTTSVVPIPANPGPPSASFTLPSNGSISCTFSNTKNPVVTQTGTITIIKDVPQQHPSGYPPGATTTVFPFTGTAPIGNFSLDLNPATPAIPQSKTFVVPAGIYSITDNPPAGWQFALPGTNGNPVCTFANGSSFAKPAGNPLQLNVTSGSSTICTFWNSPAA